ncbi:MAG: polymer-forming cytoskeletal protein, partial [Anaerolineae bacterium]|nr:polymer-forming cytoskeletal protein [Anaerolineae bacterium]
MFRRDRRPEPDQIEVTLGSRASLRGELRCDGSVRIDGVVEEGSRIETLGNVIIGSEARVAADIKAETVSVAGAYKGNLEARRVELLAGG